MLLECCRHAAGKYSKTMPTSHQNKVKIVAKIKVLRVFWESLGGSWGGSRVLWEGMGIMIAQKEAKNRSGGFDAEAWRNARGD